MIVPRDEQSFEKDVEDDGGVKQPVPIVEKVFSVFGPEKQAASQGRRDETGEKNRASVHVHPEVKHGEINHAEDQAETPAFHSRTRRIGLAVTIHRNEPLTLTLSPSDGERGGLVSTHRLVTPRGISGSSPSPRRTGRGPG